MIKDAAVCLVMVAVAERMVLRGGYRYGFNGKENDNEVKGEGNQQDYGMRVYDPRIGKFLSVDPITTKYPELTPYQFASNTPIWAIDIDGAEGGIPVNYSTVVQDIKQWWNSSNKISAALSYGWYSGAGIPVEKKNYTNGDAIVSLLAISGRASLDWHSGALMSGGGVNRNIGRTPQQPEVEVPLNVPAPRQKVTVAQEVASTGSVQIKASSKPIVVAKGIVDDFEILGNGGVQIGGVKNAFGNLEFYISTKGTEYEGRGNDVFKALYNSSISKGDVSGINGTWSRGEMGSNLRAFNKAIREELSTRGVAFKDLSGVESDALLKRAAFKTFTGSNAENLGYKNVKINRVEGEPGDYFSASLTFTK